MPRKHERTTFFAETVLEAASGRQPARISDISGGGCYIDTIVEVNVGDPVAFDIPGAENGPVRFNGTVAYHFAGMGFGVQYSNLTDAQSQFLKQFT
jgi:hypothetical protein